MTNGGNQAKDLSTRQRHANEVISEQHLKAFVPMLNLKSNKHILPLALMSIGLMSLTACGIFGEDGIETEAKYPTGIDRNNAKDDIYAEKESIFGKSGLSLLNNNKDEEDNGIGVNSFLWRASLDTVSFMPLASADPFGGVILTDWHSSPEKPNERYKLNVFIMGKSLKSDGIRVRVFRQNLKGNNWRDASTSGDLAIQLEDTILTRARQLRVASLAE